MAGCSKCSPRMHDNDSMGGHVLPKISVSTCPCTQSRVFSLGFGCWWNATVGGVLLTLLASYTLISYRKCFSRLPGARLPSRAFCASCSTTLHGMTVLCTGTKRIGSKVVADSQFVVPSLVGRNPFSLASASNDMLGL